MKHVRQEHGYAMLLVIFTTVLISVIGLGLLTMNANSVKTSKNEEVDQAVFYVAEGGLNVKSAEIFEFAKVAKQFVDQEIINCSKDPSNSYCSDINYLNEVFLKYFLTENLKPYVNLESELNYDNFSIPNSEANFKFTCKQNSINEGRESLCKDFLHTPSEELIVIINSTGNINGKTRTIKQEIKLGYLPIPDEPEEISDVTEDSIPINESKENWWVLPIYQFDSISSPDFKNNNWTINGFDLKNCNGNNNSPDCKRDLELASHEQKKLDLLKKNYEDYHKSCSNSEINKSQLKLGTHTFENNSVWFIDDIETTKTGKDDDDIIINNINKSQVDIVICDTANKKDSIFDKLNSLKATNTSKMNIYVVSDTKKETKIQHLKIQSNIFYAPNFIFDKLNAEGNYLCTNFFVDKVEKINGAGTTLTNSCSGATPLPVIPPPYYVSNKPYNFYKIISTVEL